MRPGTWGDDTRVMFTCLTVRYLRFVALSEINGQPWTSVAELRVAGGPP